MKNKHLLPLLLLLIISSMTGTACVTGSGQGSWKSYPAIPSYWDYRTGNIQVIIDHVAEENIASQLGVIAETLLKSKIPEKNKIEFEKDIHAVIDIQVEQRSFLHGAELLNTIYITCLIRDEHGEIFGRENEYISGKKNIISSKEQHRLLKKVLGRVLTDQKRRYRDIEKQRKDSHA